MKKVRIRIVQSTQGLEKGMEKKVVGSVAAQLVSKGSAIKIDEDGNEITSEKPVSAPIINAKDTIQAIQAAETIEDVNSLVSDDEERVTVLEAQEIKIAELTD